MSSGDLIALMSENNWQDMDITITDNAFPGVLIARGTTTYQGRPASGIFAGWLDQDLLGN